MREKGWEERGPKAHSKNSDFTIVHTNITDRKNAGGINFCKDYSMITD